MPCIWRVAPACDRACARRAAPSTCLCISSPGPLTSRSPRLAFANGVSPGCGCLLPRCAAWLATLRPPPHHFTLFYVCALICLSDLFHVTANTSVILDAVRAHASLLHHHLHLACLDASRMHVADTFLLIDFALDFDAGHPGIAKIVCRSGPSLSCRTQLESPCNKAVAWPTCLLAFVFLL